MSVLAALGLELCAPIATAQTVRPVIAEYKSEARGRLELDNNSIVPITVVLEAKSFTLDVNGHGTYLPLRHDIHLKLSATSLRIPPKQIRYVFYEATADELPAWFVITSAFMGLPKQNGLNVQIQLPHTVYLLQKHQLERADVHVQAVGHNPDTKSVVLEIENSGASLGRALGVQVISSQGKVVAAGFPLMPLSDRRLEVPWDRPDEPTKVVVQFNGFEIVQPLGHD